MLFLVSKDPFSALQLQHQLKLIGAPAAEIYLSVEEAESNLYKLPHIVLLEDNLKLSNLLYLTQSVKIYDSQINVMWLCREEGSELEKIHKGYGVTCCLTKNDYLIEQLSLKIHEMLNGLNGKDTSKKRMQLLKNNLLNMDSSID